LDLNYTQFSDISSLKNLIHLTNLDLSNNQFSDISPLKNLIHLTNLILNSNQLSDISPLKVLINLTNLDLSLNELSNISSLKNLINLTNLDLSDNQFSDISPLKDLVNLNSLDLTNNPIEKLPSWITDFNMGIQWGNSVSDGYITFYENPLKSPPLEIVKQGKEAVENYFEQIKKQDKEYLFEAKMLILGEPGAGKTSMTWKMENGDCDLPREEETTRGIDVKQYYFPLQQENVTAGNSLEKVKNQNFRLNLWDFGGQEIYKAPTAFSSPNDRFTLW